MTTGPLISIVMGSHSDRETMSEVGQMLEKFHVPFEYIISSAHRSPDRTIAFARNAAQRGIRVIIAGAGAAAHLAGVIASYTLLPVIGIPLDSSPMRGIDALLSTVQMPGGVPVATMAIGKAGARNAALFAIRILALTDTELCKNLEAFAKEQALGVESDHHRFTTGEEP